MTFSNSFEQPTHQLSNESSVGTSFVTISDPLQAFLNDDDNNTRFPPDEFEAVKYYLLEEIGAEEATLDCVESLLVRGATFEGVTADSRQ